MTYIKTFCIILFLISGTFSYSTNPINPSWSNDDIELESKNHQKTLGERILQTKLGQWFTKKVIGGKITSKQMKLLGISSLIVGAASLVFLFLIGTVTYAWWIAFGLAIIGDILSISALMKTSKQKKEFRKARTMAWFGLILSLLTGLLPLGLFILILISVR